jgi:hypothetical protein
MGPADVLWLNMDRPTNLMVIVSVVLLESVPDWDRVLDVVRERIIDPYPVFSQRARLPRGLTGHRWEDDPDFDLERHVHRATLRTPSCRPTSRTTCRAPSTARGRSGRCTSSTATGPVRPSSSASTTPSPTASP